MRTVENNCIGCPQGCIHCGKEHEETIICDNCQDYADYSCSEGDYCEYCFEQELDNIWENMKSNSDIDFNSLSFLDKLEELRLIGFKYEKI